MEILEEKMQHLWQCQGVACEVGAKELVLLGNKLVLVTFRCLHHCRENNGIFLQNLEHEDLSEVGLLCLLHAHPSVTEG